MKIPPLSFLQNGVLSSDYHSYMDIQQRIFLETFKRFSDDKIDFVQR